MTGALSFSDRGIEASLEGRKENARTVKGIHFNIPDDWPIKEQGGALQPIPVEEYIVLKFGKVDERFEQLDNRTTAEFDRLKSQVKELNEKISDINERLKDLERWLKHGEARHL